jgi:hypothetical protein
VRLAGILGKPLEEVRGDAAAVYKDKVIEHLDVFAQLGKHCLLAIDGLDEAMGWHVDASLLPPDAIPGLRIIASARVIGDFGSQDWLQQLKRFHFMWNHSRSG